VTESPSTVSTLAVPDQSGTNSFLAQSSRYMRGMKVCEAKTSTEPFRETAEMSATSSGHLIDGTFSRPAFMSTQFVAVESGCRQDTP